MVGVVAFGHVGETRRVLAAEAGVAVLRASALAPGLYRAVGNDNREAAKPSYCDACFTGDYPTTLTDHDEAERRHQLEYA